MRWGSVLLSLGRPCHRRSDRLYGGKQFSEKEQGTQHAMLTYGVEPNFLRRILEGGLWREVDVVRPGFIDVSNEH